MREFLHLLGKNIGAISGAGAALLWVAAMWDPSNNWDNTPVSFSIAMIMVVLCVMAMIASYKGHGIVLIILFLVSFYPIGYYLWTVPHWVRWIGAFNVGFVIAGLLVWRTKPIPEENETSPPGDGATG